MSGVVQGSHTGPLLFLLFINDIFETIQHSQLELFADDSRLRKNISSEEDVQLLQEDINSFSLWSRTNGMPINVTKSSCITFSRLKFPIKHNYKIENNTLIMVDSVRDLGLTLDSNWKFDLHRSKIASKAYQTLGFIRRSTYEFKNPATLISLFKSLIMPTLNYASTIWKPHYKSDYTPLEGIIHKFLRYLSFYTETPMTFIDHNYNSISKKFNISTLESNHQMNDLLFANRIITDNRIPTHLKLLFKQRNSDYNLRRPRPLEETHTSGDFLFHSPLFRMRREWNSLSLELETTIDNNKLKQHLKKTRLRHYD